MNKKIIVFGSFVAVFIMLMIPSVNAIEQHQVKNKITEKQETYDNKKDNQFIQKDFLLPRFFMTVEFSGEGFTINIQSNKIFHIGHNTTIYLGNVIINGTLSGDSQGCAYTRLAGKIYFNFLRYFWKNLDPSKILPGFYFLSKEFTIKARYFCLFENFTAIFPTFGRGYFVRIIK